MKDKKHESRMGKLLLEYEAQQYRVYIEIEPGADIPYHLREILIAVAREGNKKLSEREIQIIEELFRQDLELLEDWVRVEIKQALIKSNIGIKIKSGPRLQFDGIFQLPKTNIVNISRNKKLSKLEKNFSLPGIIIQKISGTGGVGKSQLANFYAQLKMIAGFYQWVVWLKSGEIEENEGITKQFVDLGKRLEINVKEHTTERLCELIYQQLSEKGQGLIVIDNVFDYSIVKKFLPIRFHLKNIHVLMTTQDTRDWGPEIRNVFVGIFRPEESLEYINKVLDHGKYEELRAKELGKILGYFPLALTQALAYINNNIITISGYIEAFKKEYEKLLDYAPFQTDDHQTTVLATVNLSMSHIKHSNGLRILLACCYLGADEPIDGKLFQFWVGDLLDANAAMEELKRYSLIRNSGITNHIQIHMLTQIIIRGDKRDTTKSNTLFEFATSVIKYIENNNNLFDDEENRKIWDVHLQQLCSNLKVQGSENLMLKKIMNVLNEYRCSISLKTSMSLCRNIENMNIGQSFSIFRGNLLRIVEHLESFSHAGVKNSCSSEFSAPHNDQKNVNKRERDSQEQKIIDDISLSDNKKSNNNEDEESRANKFN